MLLDASHAISQVERTIRTQHSLVCEQDWVMEEHAIAFNYNGIAHAVMMATPADLADFALGFTLTAGIINNPNALVDLEIEITALGIILNISISSRQFFSLKEHRRNLIGNSGCGLCGVESLQQTQKKLTTLKHAELVSFNVVKQAISDFTAQQSFNLKTGAAHGVALCDSKEGTIILMREDVGRHNALDKLIGAMLRQKANRSDCFVLCSSRASFEMVEKAIIAGIQNLITMSAPTSKAISIAKQHNLNLISFAKIGRQVIYSRSK